MNEQIKTLWVDALLSGEYTQGQGVLRQANGAMCCLGVLCDLYHKVTGQGGWADQSVQSVTQNGTFYTTPFLSQSDPRDQIEYDRDRGAYLERFILPDEVADWAGLPVIRRGSGDRGTHPVMNLMTLNDGEIDFSRSTNDGSKFKEGFEPQPFLVIADHIKNNL